MTTVTRHQTSTCADCIAGWRHCHEASIEHADGSTECIDPACHLDHWQHDWHLPCNALHPPCPCSPEEHVGSIHWHREELEAA